MITEAITKLSKFACQKNVSEMTDNILVTLVLFV